MTTWMPADIVLEGNANVHADLQRRYRPRRAGFNICQWEVLSFDLKCKT